MALFAEDRIILCRDGCWTAGEQDPSSEVLKVMGAKAHAFAVLDLFVQPFRGAVRFSVTPGVFNPLAMDVDTVGGLSDWRAVTVLIGGEPIGKSRALIFFAGFEKGIEFHESFPGKLKIRRKAEDFF